MYTMRRNAVKEGGGGTGCLAWTVSGKHQRTNSLLVNEGEVNDLATVNVNVNVKLMALATGGIPGMT